MFTVTLCSNHIRSLVQSSNGSPSVLDSVQSSNVKSPLTGMILNVFLCQNSYLYEIWFLFTYFNKVLCLKQKILSHQIQKILIIRLIKFHCLINRQICTRLVANPEHYCILKLCFMISCCDEICASPVSSTG